MAAQVLLMHALTTVLQHVCRFAESAIQQAAELYRAKSVETR
jgi:hypothetical protein